MTSPKGPVARDLRRLLKFDAFSTSHDLNQRHTQATSDPADGSPRRVNPAGLNMRQPGRMQLGAMSNLFLAEVFPFSNLTDRGAKLRLRF